MTPQETIDYCNRRLAALAGGPEKMERLIASDPGSVRVAGWRRRIAEYQRSIEGLTLRRRLAELDLQSRGLAPAGSDTVEGEG